MLKKYAMLAAVMAMVLVVAACGGGDKEETQDKEKAKQDGAQPSVDISDDELVPEDDVVAVINGVDVNGKTYNIVYSQLKLQASQMGQEIDLDNMKEATLDSLIDRELLIQQAEQEGIEITDEKVAEELATIKETNKDGLETILEQYQMTEDDFREQLKFELALTEYKASLSDVEVTDEEIEEYYEQAKEGNEDIPPLDEIKSDLKQQMLEQKTTESLQEKIDKVKEKADIEKKIEA